MKTGRLVLILLLFVAGAAAAHHGRLQEHLLSAQVISAGRYADATAGFVRTAAHSAVDRSAVLVEETDRVPLRLGERFGFCFELTGFLEDGEADLQKIVTHPSVAVDDRAIDGYVDTIELSVINGGAAGCIGHAVDTDRELIPGKWTIGLGAGETTLVERTFMLE